MKISNLQKKINQQRKRRVLRVRLPMLETKNRFRLSVFRSSQFLFVQIIDDMKRKTLVSVSDKDIKEKLTKTERAKKVGTELAKLALAKKIKQVVFDKGWYKFHGRVKALADSARSAGLEF